MAVHRLVQPQDASLSSPILPLIFPLFIGSGCAALIYEVVWLQMLQLVIGSTAFSIGVLLATFMGGMCLGSLVLPRLVPPHRHPLRIYAALEAGIAILGVALVYVVPLIERLYTVTAGGFIPSLVLRSLVAATCLLPPTVLMGATLPAVARWVQSTPRGVSWLGLFYGGNTIGAVFGCLLAGFYLLPRYDMATAAYAAATINLTVAGLSLALSTITRYRPSGLGDVEFPDGEPPSSARSGRAQKRMVYVASAVSGLTGLGAEVVWTRQLSLSLGATVYTFSIILAVFLLGLGLGSGLGSLIARSSQRPAFALGVCQWLQAVSIAWASYMISEAMPYWPINPALALSPWSNFQLDIVRCACALLPGAMLWGASFPLALGLVASKEQDPGRLVGSLLSANTLGAIIGAIAFSIIVIPTLGTQAAQRVLVGLCTASALLVWLSFFGTGRPFLPSHTDVRRSMLGLIAALALAVGLAIFLARSVAPPSCLAVAFGRNAATNMSQMAPGVMPEKATPGEYGKWDRTCSFVGEGANVSVAVTKTRSGWRYFHGAGKVQASSDPQDMRLQRMLGHLAALSHKTRNPESVLVVALGAGVTAGSFVPYDSVKKIVICDIEPMVPEQVAPRFAKENYDVVRDPRTRIVLDDGRHFMRTTREKFDVITSDPIDPWVKGCAALNTVEYYRMCRDRLNPGGVMALWMPLYESSLDAAKSLIATFFEVFPSGILWSNDTGGAGYDVVLFGSLDPIRIDVNELQGWLDAHPKVKNSLAEAGFGATAGHDVALDLLSTYAGRASDLRDWMQGAQINTDRNLRLQYLAGMGLNASQATLIFRGILGYYRFPRDIFVGSPEQVEKLRSTLVWVGRK
ncbi:MAG TPA: SAM-dependent methyltransferase [Polyangia bacterium]